MTNIDKRSNLIAVCVRAIQNIMYDVQKKSIQWTRHAAERAIVREAILSLPSYVTLIWMTSDGIFYEQSDAIVILDQFSKNNSGEQSSGDKSIFRLSHFNIVLTRLRQRSISYVR